MALGEWLESKWSAMAKVEADEVSKEVFESLA